MNVQDAPYLVDDFRIGFTDMASGDDAFGGCTVEVGTSVMDEAVTYLFRSSLVM